MPTRPAAPPWLLPLLVWRIITAGAAAVAAIVIAAGASSSNFSPLARWGLAGALAVAAVLGAVAVRGTMRRVHVGRLAGFVLDGLVTVVAGFIALDRMHLFTGLDTAGEEFHDAAPWALIILVGWLIVGFAQRGASDDTNLVRIGRWTMGIGLAVLLLFMNLVPGLIELAQRLVWLDVLPFTIATAAALGFTRILWSDAADAVFGTTRDERETMDGLVFVAPNMLGFLAFFAGPLIASLFISFTDWDGLTDARFVGFDNYVALFSDDLFLTSLRNIVVFGLLAIPAAVVPALLLAALLNTEIPGVKFFRAIYFLPSIAGVVGVTLIWKQLFNSTVGYLNYSLLRATDAVNAVLGTSFEAIQPEWISDGDIAMFAVIILFAWQQLGFNVVLFLAGMQSIDSTLYEAAELDGATGWKRFRHITVPLLKPTTVFVVATTTILGLQMFNEPFILQAPSTPAGPNNSTLTPVVYLYQNAFQQFEIGYASAVAWALFILIFGVTLINFRYSKSGLGGDNT